MFEWNAQDVVRQYGVLAFFLPFVPSLLAAGLSMLIVHPGQRMQMLGVALAAVLCCFFVNAALLPLLEAGLPEAWLRWQVPFILGSPAVVILALALYLRGSRGWMPAAARA